MKYTSLKTDTIYIFSYLPVIFAVIFIGFMLLQFPETASQGISDGVDLSLGILIPSLYPFMVLSSFITEADLLKRVPPFINKLSEKLFALKGNCIGIILISLIGGLPTGCKMTADLYDKGKINRVQGKRLMLFCFCCGPAFTISSVGLYILGSKKAGVILFISLVLSCLTVGMLSRFVFTENEKVVYRITNNEEVNFSTALVKAISSGSAAMLNVCAWVIIFSCINRLIEIIPISNSMKLFTFSVLEVTNAVYTSSGNLSLPIITGIIGFGGLCGHCQVMPYIIKLKLKYKYFITSRIVSGALSVIYCELLMKLIPVSYEVFSMGTRPNNTDLTISAVYSISMLGTAALFLLGDSAVFRIKAKKDHRN